MIFKNIAIHNVVELRTIETREGVERLRVPQSVREKLYFGEQAQREVFG